MSLGQERPQAAFRIGVLPLGSPANPHDVALVDALKQGLRDAGLIEGRDVSLEVVWVDNESYYPTAVQGLVQRGARLLVPAGTSASLAAKRNANLPIVFTTVGDPVGVGLVDSLARPGGNVTGFSDVLLDLSGKLLELAMALSEPRAPVHYLWYAGWANGRQRLQATQSAATSAGVLLRDYSINSLAEAGSHLSAMKKDGASALIVQPSPFTFLQRTRLIEGAAVQRIGTIFAWPVAAREGAVLGYGPDYADLYRRAASYVHKIVQGARPADLPIEQPLKFELVVNLRGARAIGLSVPTSLMLRAHDVIV